MLGIRRKLREWWGSTTPIRPGHRYRDQITGERIDVLTIGSKVTVERLDADRRPQNSVKTSVFRTSVDNGFLTHDPDTCPKCDDT